MDSRSHQMQELVSRRAETSWEMPAYRLYWVGTDDHFKLIGVSFECASDREALEAAQEMIGEFAAEFTAVEVWVTGRFVGRVGEPSPPSAA
jgi:hypothetical protein